MRSKQSRMKSKRVICGVGVAVAVQLGVLAGSAQADVYGYTGSETTVTLDPGTYIITAYGAAGGWAYLSQNGSAPAVFALGGLGAEMSAEFNFSTPTNLTLLVGNEGFSNTNDSPDQSVGGGGGGSFVVEGSTPLVVAGGGGGAAANASVGGIDGPNANIITNGSAGGGTAGGSGGAGGNGGIGGGNGITGYVRPAFPGLGAGGGGGFYTDGGGGSPYFGDKGFSFEDGGTGGRDNSINDAAGGGFGGGGGGYQGQPYDAFGGGGGGYSGGGGGGEMLDTGDGCEAGGGGGSFIDSSAIAILAEVSGSGSPDDPYNGEIIITAVPEPAAAGVLAIGSLALLRRGRRWRGLLTFLLGAMATLGIPAARAAVTFPIYVSSGGQSIVQVSSTGVVSPFATLAAGSGPLGLAFDGSGNLYVADGDPSNPNRIDKITPGGVVSLFATLPAGGFSLDLAFDGSGNLYESDFDTDQIRKITPAGAVSTFATLTNNSEPAGLAFDGSGNLYAACCSTHESSKITSGGMVSLFATLPVDSRSGH